MKNILLQYTYTQCFKEIPSNTHLIFALGSLLKMLNKFYKEGKRAQQMP